MPYANDERGKGRGRERGAGGGHILRPPRRPSDNQVVIMARRRGGGRSLEWSSREHSAPSQPACREWMGRGGYLVGTETETEPGRDSERRKR